MRARQILCMVAVLFLVLGCGPSPEQIATMTAAAWTPTPAPTATPTPIPYGLTVHVTDESGAGIGANVILLESGDDQPVQTDASGTYTWPNVNGPSGNLEVTAPGYHAASQPVTLERGPNELAVMLQRDPLGLAAAEACAPDEKLLYIEDFQDTKAQGWQNITAAAEFGAQNGWVLGPIEEGNIAAYFTGTYHDLDALQDMTFDNLVWRLKVMTTGNDGWSFLNLKFSDPNPEGGTRYVAQWGATPQLDLTRMQFPSPGAFSVARSGFRAAQSRWYNVEFSDYEGQVQIWIDGKKEIDYQDPQPLGPGVISLEVNVPADPNTVYYFDDLAVCELSAPFTTSLYAPTQ